MMKLHPKRPFLLLEVLIAIFLISLCLLPLLAPYGLIFRDQRRFSDKIYLDYATSQLYAGILEKLYLNTIPWEQLKSTAPVPIDSTLLEQTIGHAIPWKGSYAFTKHTQKPKEGDKDYNGGNAPFSAHLFKLDFTFTPQSNANIKDKKMEYTYDIFIARQLPGAEASLPTPPAEQQKAK
jgi:hypothetical protein